MKETKITSEEQNTIEEFNKQPEVIKQEREKRLELINQYDGVESPPLDVIKAIVREKLKYNFNFVDRVVVSKIVYECKEDNGINVEKGVVEGRSININGVTYTAYLMDDGYVEPHHFI